MSYPTFTVEGRAFVIVPREVLAELGALRPSAAERQRKARGEALRVAREAAGLSQTELGARIGKTQATVSRAETGEMRTGARYLGLVLAACGLPADWTPGDGKAKR